MASVACHKKVWHGLPIIEAAEGAFPWLSPPQQFFVACHTFRHTFIGEHDISLPLSPSPLRGYTITLYDVHIDHETLTTLNMKSTLGSKGIANYKCVHPRKIREGRGVCGCGTILWHGELCFGIRDVGTILLRTA